MSQLSQKLRGRHLNMIAIGGSIGTGIFLASGYSISVGGPGSALLAYLLMAVVVYFLMTSLAEMSAYQPTAGTFCEYSTQYVGKSFGFAMGYNYWLNWAITIAAEISAAALITQYWFPHVNSLVFSSFFFVIILLCNIYSVKVYGEAEYGLSFIKVAAIMAFIVLGLALVLQKPQFGTPLWSMGDAPFHQGWYGFIAVFLFAGFSFQGTELIGVASAETKNPEVAVPKSIKLVFWRLALFYVLTIGLITLLIPYNDPRLAYTDNVSMSPFTLVFSLYLHHWGATLINFIALVAVLSAANASMYSSTRILWYLAKTRQAPAKLTQVTRYGIPLWALGITALIGSLVFLSSLVGNGTMFNYLLQISSLSGFIAWFGIALSHFQFRRAIQRRDGHLRALPYLAKWSPYVQIFSMAILLMVIVAQVLPIMHGSAYHWQDLVITYASVIVFILIYVIHYLYSVHKSI